MQAFQYDIEIKATSEKDAESKMESLTVLASHLTAKELYKLADIIKNDPEKTEIAKMALGV